MIVATVAPWGVKQSTLLNVKDTAYLKSSFAVMVFMRIIVCGVYSHTFG